MPIYDFECTECKKVHEMLLSIKERDRLLCYNEYKFSCPSCGGRGYIILPSKVAKAVIR